MKKTQLLISGLGLLTAGIGSATAASSFEGSLYSDVQALHQELTMTTATRGAQGPIRSLDVQQPAIDIYTSLSRYQSDQMFDQQRGAKGPIRSDSDMVAEQNRAEWKRIVGPFDGSAD